MAQLAKKVKKLATFQFLNFKLLLNGRGFAKFKKNYKLKGELGRGGFGIVYRAVRISDETPVAVKFIKRRHVREWGKLNDERVPMEICMLAKCTRINGVVRLLDWYSMPEGFLIVMERPYPCIDLFDFIRTQTRLDENLARFLFRQVAQTILECVQKKVLHRDIKDENVVIDLVNGQTRLIDFGAATILKKTNYTDFQGTRLYCPPEWFLHSLYLGKEAAVWSLGVLLYNMLNGRLPFRNEKDICTAHLLGPIPFYAPLSAEAKDLTEKCLRFDPFARCSLEEIMEHPWITAPTADWLVLSASSAQVSTSESEYDGVEAENEGVQKAANGSGTESGVGSASDLTTGSRTSSSTNPQSTAENEKAAKQTNNELHPKQRMAKTSLLHPPYPEGMTANAAQSKTLRKEHFAKNHSMNHGTLLTCWVHNNNAKVHSKINRKSTIDSGQISAFSSLTRGQPSRERLRDRENQVVVC